MVIGIVDQSIIGVDDALGISVSSFIIDITFISVFEEGGSEYVSTE